MFVLFWGDFMLEEFKKYVSNYDLNNELIKLKYEHSLRVMNLARKYAKMLGFNKKETELATLIGLLHDYGRFEQIRVYNSFNDRKTIDHADLGIQILFDDGEIRKYTNNEKDYELIEFAIKNHNKYEIEEIDNKNYLKQAKLIRDIDKIDILYINYSSETYQLIPSDDEISVEVISDIINHKIISYKNVKNINDQICIYFSYAFDIYNDICLEEVRKNIENMYVALNNKKFEKVKDIVLEYIDERMNENVRY